MVVCEVCQKSDQKYKCPKCLLRYCSSSCYRTHTENPCLLITEKQDIPENGFYIDKNPNETHKRVQVTDDDDVKIPEEKLQQLRFDDDVLASLRNPHLRHILVEINSSTDHEKAIKAAMAEPIFVEFVDACLGVIEPEVLT